jgi:N-acetylglucosamine kinase-like BadF-type ATPase
MKRLIFGLDGGGTGSRLRIADEKNRLLVTRAGEGVNPQAVGYPVAVERIASLFHNALRDLEETHRWTGGTADFVAGCFAIAGGGVPEEARKLEGELRKVLEFRCPLLFVSDAEAALVGGLKSLEGMILVAGTGSIALARLRDGTTIRAGGYGHFLGDEGSAFWIGSQAVIRSIRSSEGRDLPTEMLSALYAYFGIQHTHEFISLWYQRFDKALIAGAARVVEEFREREDPLAQDIFLSAAKELSRLVESVYHRVEGKLEAKKLLLWGGQLEHNQWLQRAVTHNLRLRIPALEVKKAQEDAAFGACLLAAQKALIVGSSNS